LFRSFEFAQKIVFAALHSRRELNYFGEYRYQICRVDNLKNDMINTGCHSLRNISILLSAKKIVKNLDDSENCIEFRNYIARTIYQYIENKHSKDEEVTKLPDRIDRDFMLQFYSLRTSIKIEKKRVLMSECSWLISQYKDDINTPEEQRLTQNEIAPFFPNPEEEEEEGEVNPFIAVWLENTHKNLLQEEKNKRDQDRNELKLNELKQRESDLDLRVLQMEQKP
jgi:hypothetical protein